MESWRKVWRGGFSPLFFTVGGGGLGGGLENHPTPAPHRSGPPPPPPVSLAEWAAGEAACALVFCAWKGEGLETVGEGEQFFASFCFDADSPLGEPAACRYFLNWFDDTPRTQMRQELLAEVELVLAQRFPVEMAQPETTRLIAA